eukprot:scpid44365/ scgid3273/ 
MPVQRSASTATVKSHKVSASSSASKRRSWTDFFRPGSRQDGCNESNSSPSYPKPPSVNSTAGGNGSSSAPPKPAPYHVTNGGTLPRSGGGGSSGMRAASFSGGQVNGVAHRPGTAITSTKIGGSVGGSHGHQFGMTSPVAQSSPDVRNTIAVAALVSPPRSREAPADMLYERASAGGQQAAAMRQQAYRPTDDAGDHYDHLNAASTRNDGIHEAWYQQRGSVAAADGGVSGTVTRQDAVHAVTSAHSTASGSSNSMTPRRGLSLGSSPYNHHRRQPSDDGSIFSEVEPDDDMVENTPKARSYEPAGYDRLNSVTSAQHGQTAGGRYTQPTPVSTTMASGNDNTMPGRASPGTSPPKHFSEAHIRTLHIPATPYSGVVWRQDCETLGWHSRTLTLDGRKLLCTDLDKLGHDASETFLLADLDSVDLATHDGEGESEFQGGYFELKTQNGVCMFAVAGEDDSGARGWVSAVQAACHNLVSSTHC